MHLKSSSLSCHFRAKIREDNEQLPDDASSGPLSFFLIETAPFWVKIRDFSEVQCSPPAFN
jgi:hypothetical protein